MSLLSTMVRVIGQVLDTTHRVGRVRQILTFQIGGKPSIAVEQPQPVSPELKPKRSRVKQDTQVQSPKAETLPVPIRTKKSLEAGTQPTTPVRQVAKSKPKRKSSVVQPTTQVKSRKSKPKAAQAESGVSGKQRKTPVSKTPQHAKPKAKRKP